MDIQDLVFVCFLYFQEIIQSRIQRSIVHNYYSLMFSVFLNREALARTSDKPAARRESYFVMIELALKYRKIV